MENTEAAIKKNKNTIAGKNIAMFAGGCFWCMEKPFEQIDGVGDVISGYAGGTKESANYSDVSAGKTKHVEVVQMHYDPSLVSYEQLLEAFWKSIDPTDPNGQFVDKGNQYKTAIYYYNEDQKNIALQTKKRLEALDLYRGKPIVTPIVPAPDFYAAEDYHQDYYKNNKIKYSAYRFASGRDQFIKRAWKDKLNQTGVLSSKDDDSTNTNKSTAKENILKMKFVKPSDAELKKTLTPIQYKVTQKDGTEKPFANEYWDNKEPGIYVDILSGEALFLSIHKYKSGTGWPSFTQAVSETAVTEHIDKKLFSVRTEIRSSVADNHLGHVFDDGPGPNGKRFCMNSASMRFIPQADMEKEGYGKYLSELNK